MLTICEDCGKKYNINESRIRGSRARFTCKECGHIIIVNKSDTNRPLISSASALNASFDESSTIDLLKEMEAPFVDSNQEKEASKLTETEQKQPLVKRKNRGIPLFAYFIIGMLFSLICVSLATGYLYTEHLYSEYLSDISKPVEGYRQDLMVESTFIFGAVWSVALLFIVILGGYVHKRFKQLVGAANKLGTGDYDVTIVKRGPREVRDLAFSLERIRNHLKKNLL